MLARSAMIVVFVPGQVISQGSSVYTGLTAGVPPKSFLDMAHTPVKVPQ